MDQDAFRQLISTSGTTSSSSRPSFSASRNALASRKAPAGKKPAGQKLGKKQEDAADLKPRKLKPAGVPVDKTQLHSLLRDLTGHDVDEAAHPGSARGLDLSLVARARSEAAKVDDAADEDALEAVFAANASALAHAPAVPVEKKTRAEILAQLKASRASASGSIETAPANSSHSKFRPIGFKPVEQAGKKKKKAEGILDGERKKKKRKAEGTTNVASTSATSVISTVAASITPLAVATPVSAPADGFIGDDDDIFADAGEYQGVDLGESDDEDKEPPSTTQRESSPTISPDVPVRRGWFGDDPSKAEEVAMDVKRSPTPAADLPQSSSSRLPEDEEEVVQLRPLASSTVPSIREMLAADQALAAEEKRRARKEKRKKAA